MYVPRVIAFLLCADIYNQVQLFAHLTVAKVITAQTMYDLLRSFSAVLDEFGVSHGRAKKAALCAAEGLMIVCSSLPPQLLMACSLSLFSVVPQSKKILLSMCSSSLVPSRHT